MLPTYAHKIFIQLRILKYPLQRNTKLRVPNYVRTYIFAYLMNINKVVAVVKCYL